jgi:hypothetical protein
MNEQLIRQATMGNHDDYHLCGVDMDDMCAYSTPKVTVIRSWKLGVISNALKFATVLYIIVGPMYFDRGYMKMSDVDGGGVKNTVFAPGTPTLSDYCCICATTDSEPESPDVFPGDEEYHYCNSIGGGPGACCGQLDQRGMRSVIREAGGVALATNFKYETFEVQGTVGPDACVIPTDPACTIGKIDPTPGDGLMYYVMDVESFTIGISHAISSVNFQGIVSFEGMKGRLMDSTGQGKPLREWPSSEPVFGQDQSESRALDIISVQELLDAAGVDLEERGATPSKPGRTLRDNGFQLLVYVDYVQTGQTATSPGSMEYR